MSLDQTLLENVILSTNPCPLCQEAAKQPPMTIQDWADSVWGLPGSDGRYCGDFCHCILMPIDMLEEFPAINEQIKLRGEEGSEVPAIVDISPREEGLKAAMDEWNADFGKLPPEIYDMDLYKVEDYLRTLMKKRGRK